MTDITAEAVLDTASADVDDDLDDVAGVDDPALVPDAPAGPSTPTPHTPGGLPAVPLTVIGANTTVAAVSAAVITAGGPVTGLAAAGLAVTAAGASVLRRRSAAKQAAAGAKTGPRGGSGKNSPGPRRTLTPSGGGSGSRRGSASGHGGPARAGSVPGPRGHAPRTAPGAAGRSGARSLRATQQAAKLRSAEAGQARKGALGAGGAVKAARAARREAAPTRGQQRRQDTADRRRLSDARRASKAARKAEQRAAKGKGPSKGGAAHGDTSLNLRKSPRPDAGSSRRTRTKSGRDRARRDGAVKLSARERARQARQQLRSRARAARDERDGRRLSRLREVRRRARARARMWRRLTASALRYQARRLLAAGISVPFFALGMITHPIGVRLGWRWLMWPGQRVYARLAGAAKRAREDRDAAIREEYGAEVEAVTETDDPIAAQVRRAPRHHNAHAGSSTGGSTTMSTAEGPGFLFNESAADMENAAKNYDPDGMMHVLATIEGFPEALESVANTFAVLAQKSDEEFPLEPEVGAALDQIYKALQAAIDEAEETVKTFRLVHEQDIRRHTDPRNNAEEGWDTTNN